LLTQFDFQKQKTDFQTNNMKLTAIFSLLALGILLSCSTAQTTQTIQTPQTTQTLFITWDKKMVDLGKVKKGEKRTLFFEFTNTSGADIQIDIVDACECTKVDFPRGVVKPGGKGRLDATFDSTEKDAPETIGINIVFKQTDAAGNPRIEMVEYKFEIEK
jgi:phage tail tube protein FII